MYLCYTQVSLLCKSYIFQSPDQAHAATRDICQFLVQWSNFYSLNHWVPLWTNTTMDNMEHFSSPDSQWMTVRMTLHLSITVHTTDFSNLSGLSCWLRHEAAISTHPEEWIPYQSKNERNQGCWIKVESSIPCHVPMCCSPFSPTYLKYSCVMLTSAV